MTSLITEEMRGAAGALLEERVSHPVAESDVRRWRIAVAWPEAPASADPRTAPWDFNPFAWSCAETRPALAADLSLEDPDRPEKLAGIPGPGLGYQLHGGLEVEYGTAMVVGDVITSRTVLGDYAERDGRAGRMLVTPLIETWTTQRGDLVKRTTLNLLRYGGTATDG